MESGRERMGQALAQGERRFRHKIQSASKIAKSFKTLQPQEIEQHSNDMVAHLPRENRVLIASLEAKAPELYQHMCQNLSHCGKDFTKVGKRNNRDTWHEYSKLVFLFKPMIYLNILKTEKQKYLAR